VDIGGHPPNPLGPPTLPLPASLVVAHFTIFGSDLGPKLLEAF